MSQLAELGISTASLVRRSSREGLPPTPTNLQASIEGKVFLSPGEKIQVHLREPKRTRAEDGGHLITFFVSYLRKYFMLKHLEARGVEPLFR
jgi:hypothetical protein